jgi:quinoprotein glucose dehydrogenase
MRYSPLTQITPANVGNLKQAWVYHMRPADMPEPDPAAGGRGRGRGPGGPPAGAPQAGGEEGAPPPGRGFGGGGGRGGGRFAPSEATPLVVNGVMYLSTPYGRVVALDPTTGKEVWVYKLPTGQPATRGVEYFPGDEKTAPQIVVATSDGKLFTLDAKSGALNAAFGVNGIVDLNTPEVTHNLPRANIGVTTPPSMYRNLIIIGGRLPESSGPGPAGDVRAFDIHDGKLAWTFHSIPKPGEPNFGTWVGDSADYRSGVNVWGFITVDAARGIAYLPFGAASGDEAGVDRPGNDLYSSSLVAVDARTGKYMWHFQAVHHDIFDFDLESAPLLMDVKKGGKTIPAVALIEKTSLLYILDRVTGKPIYGVEERPVAQSDVPLEKTSATQPFPVKPAPLARQSISMEELATVTPELAAACRKLVEDNKMVLGGPFLPPTYNRVRVNFPSSIGGVNWGGGAFDPKLGYYFVNVMNLGQIMGIKDPASGPVNPDIVGTNKPGGRTGPYSLLPLGGRFKDNASNMPCNQPPWGEMVAVNVNTGDIAWKVPLGITDTLPADKQKTGRPGIGGPIATAGRLVFIGATDDNRFRALDAKNGNELWSVKLDSAAATVPITYQGKDGKQYVVVTATGNGYVGEPTNSDDVAAFALPAK